jgi:glycosyltransferase involved in cell wall biosynthesis
VDLFIRAVASVKKKHPEAKFWVIGDGVLRSGLEALASELRLNSNIVFWGRRGDVQELIPRMTVGVICSDSEGFSNAILEYMGHGIPVVATQTGGNAELVEHGKTGVLVPPGNHESLAEGILQCIDDREKAEQMGQQGRKRVIEEYSIKRMIQATMTLYENLLIGKGSISSGTDF